MPTKFQAKTQERSKPQLPSVTRANLRDTLFFARSVAIPLAAKGVIIRRPRVLRLAERYDSNSRAVLCLQKLRERYGSGPLLLRIPGRKHAVILSAEDARRILEETPEPFAPETTEKRAALAHFQPRGVLVSHGRKRACRRAFNEAVLDSEQPLHRNVDNLSRVVEEEVTHLKKRIATDGNLNWERFSEYWFRMVNRVVLGDSAGDDDEIRKMFDRLRQDANWAFARPRRARLRRRTHQCVAEYLSRAESGSLAADIARYQSHPDIHPEDQVSHWLFAFDPAGMATYRAVALLASHPEYLEKLRDEIDQDADSANFLPRLRCCMLESLRLWPTTPVILRETTEATSWSTGTLPAGTSLAIFAPYFHRDSSRSAEANRFAPKLWDPNQPTGRWPVMPFSAGSGVCPARHLVPLVGSLVLAALWRNRSYRLRSPERLDSRRSLPGMLNHFTLRFIASDQC